MGDVRKGSEDVESALVNLPEAEEPRALLPCKYAPHAGGFRNCSCEGMVQWPH